MGIGAEKVIMLLVVGLGGYAVYRMTRASPQVPSPDDNAMPILIPDLRGVVVPPTLDTVTDGDHVRLVAGRFYRARFETTEDPAKIGARAGVMGLAGIVYDQDSARAAGFPEWSLANPTANTRWFSGTSSASGAVPRPPGLAIMWTARPV